MIYRAAAALPYDDRTRATSGLRGQLRLMAVAADATPDWSSLVVEGPTQTLGAHGRTWFEWTATVTASGGLSLGDATPELSPIRHEPGVDRPTTPLHLRE